MSLLLLLHSDGSYVAPPTTWGTSAGVDRHSKITLATGSLQAWINTVSGGGTYSAKAFQGSTASGSKVWFVVAFDAFQGSATKISVGVCDSGLDCSVDNVRPGSSPTLGHSLQFRPDQTDANSPDFNAYSINVGAGAILPAAGDKVMVEYDASSGALAYYYFDASTTTWGLIHSRTLTTLKPTTMRAWSAGSEGNSDGSVADKWTGQFSGSAPRTPSTGYVAYDAASAGTTYNDNLSETATLADGRASTAVVAASLGEAISGADASAVTATYAALLSDGVAATDTHSSAATFPQALGETVAANDNAAAGQVMPVALAQSLSLADALVAAAAWGAALSETAAASDAASAGLVLSATRAESIAGADDYVVAGPTFNVSLNEAVSATDALSAVQVFAVVIAEPASASDTAAGTAQLGVTVSEALTAAAGQAGGSLFVVTLGEAVTAGDGITTSLSAAATLANGLIAGDSAATVAIYPAALAEPVASADSLEASSGAIVPPRQYPLAGMAQPYPGSAAPVPPLAGQSQAYPGSSGSAYPLDGATQDYPLKGAA